MDGAIDRDEPERHIYCRVEWTSGWTATFRVRIACFFKFFSLHSLFLAIHMHGHIMCQSRTILDIVVDKREVPSTIVCAYSR